jgi:hypothetical protein
MLVSTDPVFVRAAQLIDAGLVDSHTVSEVESQLFGGAARNVDLDVGVPSDDLAEYLAERTKPPSADASARFVAYAATYSLHQQWIVLVDADELSLPSIDDAVAQVPELAVRVSGRDRVHVDMAECAAFGEPARG